MMSHWISCFKMLFMILVGVIPHRPMIEHMCHKTGGFPPKYTSMVTEILLVDFESDIGPNLAKVSTYSQSIGIA